MKKIWNAVNGNGGNIAKIVLGAALIGLGAMGAFKSDEDGKYEPGEIAAEIDAGEDSTEGSSESESEE